MVQRITNPKNPKYRHYGGRGIDMDPRWNSFIAFLADMGLKPEGTSIERKNNELGYWPENCHWVTMKVQANNRRNNLTMTTLGKTMTATQWAEESGIKTCTIQWRIKAGWTPEQVLRKEIDSTLRVTK